MDTITFLSGKTTLRNSLAFKALVTWNGNFDKMLRFDYSSSRRPGVRGRPFKLFSDEIPMIDFEKQHLLQKLAEQDILRRPDNLNKKKPRGQEQDSHSLPAITGPDWDLLSGSDRQSIKSESRLHALKPDLPQIHRKIRERLGLTEKEDDNSPNYYQRSIHRSEHLKSMPKADEYKKFVQWPRLPSQQIVNPDDMQQHILNFKDEYDDQPNVQTRKGKSVHAVAPKDQRHSKYRLKLEHAKLDLPNVRLNARNKNKKDVETQTPRDLSKSIHNTLTSNEADLKDFAKANVNETIADTGQTSKQAVSIMKKSTGNEIGAKPLEIAFSSQKLFVDQQSLANRLTENDTDVIHALVHCDIPRRQLTSRKTVFNAYVGDVIKSENKSSKKVNFMEGSESDKLSYPSIKVHTDNENVNEKITTSQDSHQPKLVSSYSFQRKDLEQIARKHLLQDHTTKQQRLQNIMKHFRKIRGRQNIPHTVNLNVKAQPTEPNQQKKTYQGEIIKDTGYSSLSSHSESLTPSSVTPRNKVGLSKYESQTATSRLDMSKSQSLNEDIETCVQIRKHHKILKRHKVTKHVKTEDHNTEDEVTGKDDDLDNEIDRSLTGTELIKFYRLWKRRRKKYSSGLRKIEEPPTAADYFSNMSHKKLNGLNRMSVISETEGIASENT